jgi:hypothetical protein
METARPFAYNIGAGITGTDQIGGLAVGTPTYGFASTGLQWWNGPDEDPGYVIAQSVPSNTQPTPVFGVSASVGFFRSSALTDPSFISIANAVAGPSGGGPFASGSAAKTWLNANGYWTSYVGSTGSTGGTGATGDFNVTITQVGPNVVWSGSGSFNLTSLTLDQNLPLVTGGYNKSFAQFIVGPASTSSATTYGGSSFTTFPTNFGSGPGTAPSSSSGSLFGVVQTAGPTGPRVLLVPQGYVSGTAISGSMTYNSQTISGMGLSGGTYTWAWGSGADASSLVMVIGGTGSTGATGATGSTGATGGGYALIITPYNPPAAGKTIFPNFGVGATAGILNPNTFATGGVFWNPIDSSSVNQTSYYNGMLTRSVTASFTQNGNTAIYSGVTGAFVFIPATGSSDASFAYNPSQNPGKLTLIQASPVNFTLGGTVYISYT